MLMGNFPQALPVPPIAWLLRSSTLKVSRWKVKVRTYVTRRLGGNLLGLLRKTITDNAPWPISLAQIISRNNP